MSKWIKQWYQFLRNEFNATAFRRPTSQKIRKFQHIQIQKEFQKLDTIRRQQRHALLLQRKKLIQNQIQKNKLIQTKTEQQSIKSEQQQNELENVKNEIIFIEDEINKEKKELEEVESKLEGTESEIIMVTGYKKMAIQNHITYLHYLRTHNAGFTLHKQTQNAIENIHYLLDHNLPLPKFKLFQVFPEFFIDEIGELEESVQRLLEQKREEMKTDTVPMYRPFELDRKIDKSMVIDRLAQEEAELVKSISLKSLKLLNEHTHILNKVQNGETRFRSVKHFIMECRDVDEREEFTVEEWNAKQAVLEVYKFRGQFAQWKEAAHVKIDEYNFKTRWPAYLNGKPDLIQLYKKGWQQYRSKRKPLEDLIEGAIVEPNYLQIKIRHYLEQQTKRRKNQAIDGKIDRSVNATDAYKLFTKCLAEVEEQQLLASEEKEHIYKIAKPKDKELPGKQQERKITANQLSKILMLNHKDSVKYNLQFFSQYFGIEEKLLESVLNGISIILKKDGDRKVLKFV